MIRRVRLPVYSVLAVVNLLQTMLCRVNHKVLLFRAEDLGDYCLYIDLRDCYVYLDTSS